MRVALLGLAILAASTQAQAQSAPVSSNTPVNMTQAEIRELLDAAKATAKATRESVDYVRVTPDLLFQILTKLDKIEDKLDRVEAAIKDNTPRKR